MSIGAHDYIDQLLVKKYSQEKVDNHDNVASMVNPEEMMRAMDDYASTQRNMLMLKAKLNAACSNLVARNARYTKSANFA